MATLDNGVRAWGLSTSKYVQEAFKNTEQYLETNFDGLKFPKRAPTPFFNDYQAELDTTPVFNAAQANHYQSQIGVLRWIVELGHIDMVIEASILSSQSSMPQEGHLDAVCRIFGNLKHKHNSRIIFDPTHPLIDQAGFNFFDWK